MARQSESWGELRAAHTMRELRNARHSISMGSMGIFIRVTLAIIFMYLVVVSNLMLGITGPIIVSILFLTAFFFPIMYQSARSYMDQRRTQAEQTGGARSEAQHDG